MNRAEYIAALRGALRGKLAAGEIEDIVRDYLEFFDEGVALGKTEHQVAEELGNPVEVARQILSEEGDAPREETARKVAGIDLDGIKEGFAKGAEKVADSANRFANSANAFTREKMQRHAAKPKKEKRPKAKRETRFTAEKTGGCLMALFKLMGLLVIAPALMALLCLLVSGFAVGGAGLFATIWGFVAAAIAAPVLPVMLIVCGVVGLIFAACLSVTIMLLMLYTGRAVCLFVMDLYAGRRRRSPDWYDDGWRVGDGPCYTESTCGGTADRQAAAAQEEAYEEPPVAEEADEATEEEREETEEDGGAHHA